MAKPEYLVMAAGGISFAGSFAEEGGFPPKGINIIVATGILTLLASATERSRAGKIVTAFAWLLLIAAAYSTIPALQRSAAKAKTANVGADKHNQDRGSYIQGHPQPPSKG